MGADSTMNKDDIYYIVKIKEQYLSNLKLTTISSGYFCGRIIMTDSNYVFRLNGAPGAIVEIPRDYIEFVAPSRILWEKMLRKNLYYSE